MKPLRKTFLIFIAAIFILTAGCKKYEDGPLLSLYTKKHRVMGTWDVEYFSINGYDSTTYLKSKPFYGMYNFGKGETFYSIHPFLYSSNNVGFTENGQWLFTDNKENIQIAFTDHSTKSETHLGAYRDHNVIWKITRLTEKEMWLKNNYTDSREYFVKFKLFKNF